MKLSKVIQNLIGEGFLKRVQAELPNRKKQLDYRHQINTQMSDIQFTNFIAGTGIASVSNSFGRIKRQDGTAYRKDEYCQLVKAKWASIEEKVASLDIDHKSDHELISAYMDICSDFPTPDANSITNRLLATFWGDKLTAVADYSILRQIFDFIDEKDQYKGNTGKTHFWLPLNKKLCNEIKAELQKIKDINPGDVGYIAAMFGWEIKEYIDRVNLKNQKNNLMNNKLISSKNLILTGAPGTGKTYLAKEIAKSLAGNKYEMVQFHPSYDYSDFVEGLRPVKDTSSNGQIAFVRRDGVFKAFCSKALEDGFEKNDQGNYVIVNDDSGKKNLKPKKNQQKYVFIIDEINRGEMSKIFGELFFTIDPGYRGIDGRIKTQYANLTEHPNEFDKALGIVEQKDTNGKVINAEDFGYFFVPENVYIIGTMNDIDRSVESMDFAMRRRFAFKEVRATDRESMLDEKITDAAIRSEAIIKMCNVNYRIQTIEGLNEAYHVGPAYFGKIEGNDFDELWNNHIKGLLNEYLRGMPNAKELLDSLERAYQETELYVKLNNNGDLELDAKQSEDWKNKIGRFY